MNAQGVGQMDPKIEELLKEFDTHRDEIKKMISELEDIRSKVDTLFPTSLDTRYVRFFEEKVKSVTGLFNSLLEMRKEIAKSVKDEIEIRRKIKNAESDLDVEDLLDVRKMARKIDDFAKKKKQLQESRMVNAQDQEIDKGIEIPGLMDEKGVAINE